MNDKKHIEDILYYFEKYHYENMILDDNEAKFIHDYIINLQSKIDKAIEYIERCNFDNAEILIDMGSEYTYEDGFKEELLDILKEDK